MRILVVILCMIGLIAATPAAAASITPGGPFQADGSITIMKGGTTLSCTVHLMGTVTDGIGHITSATFTGGPLGICSAIVAVGLPWSLIATSGTGSTISGVAVNTPIGNCGPGAINAAYNNTTHTLTAANQPVPSGCSISMSITTHDNSLIIVP